jgi:hypothetical protein
MAWLTMVFTTYLFVFYFLPLVLVFYYALDGLSRRVGLRAGMWPLAGMILPERSC